MQRTRPALPGLPGLAFLGLLALGCGQSEGGRCQVDSDCSSGLECSHGETGNGVCTRPGTGQPIPDASPDRTPAAAEVEPDSVRPDSPDLDMATSFDPDVSPDQTPAADVDIDAEPDGAKPDSPAPDMTPSHDGGTSPDQTPAAAEVEPDSAEKDTARSHDTAPSSTETDAPRSEAGAIDTTVLG